MKTNTNKTLTRSETAYMARKVKDAKRIGVGGFIGHGNGEYFSISSGDVISKSDLYLIGEWDFITGNESYSLQEGMFCLCRDYNGEIEIAPLDDSMDHGWIYDAKRVVRKRPFTSSGIDDSIVDCFVMNKLYDMYDHQCWFKFGAAKLALSLGASEEEAFWIAHYTEYCHYDLMRREQVVIRSVSDIWYIVKMTTELCEETISTSCSAKGYTFYIQDLVLYKDIVIQKSNEVYVQRYADSVNRNFYLFMYKKLNKKGYWEMDASTKHTIALIKEGKNRLAKTRYDVFSSNIGEGLIATGIDSSKFKHLEPFDYRSSEEFLNIVTNSEFKKFIKGYNGQFRNIIEGVIKFLELKGIRVDLMGMPTDEHLLRSVGAFETILECASELKGKSIYLEADPKLIQKFSLSPIADIRMFELILDTDVDITLVTEPSELIKKMKPIHSSEMDMWILPKHDLRNLFIGDHTSCCQKIGGAGEDVCTEGWIDPHSINIVFGSRRKDEFYAHMWVWETFEGDLVLDSVEGRSFVDHEIVSGLILDFARQIGEHGTKVFLSKTNYGLTKAVVRNLKKIGILEDAVCPKSIPQYSYMDTRPGHKCHLIKV